ncbi:MAG TPA: Gfo/Idh/MocA family oxidoreductase, partial [Actinobacteria bacterium]|nr:Gfo/Idh/MocA family oxidoreductase [Actinomycetota bacterium]
MSAVLRAARPRVAVVGAGAMGSLHIRAIAESEIATLAMIVDNDQARASSTAVEYGVEWSTDPGAAVAADAAIIATPGFSHAEVSLPMLEAGLPVLIEKPLTMDEPSCGEIVAQAAIADVPIMCGFVERFNPVISATLKRLDGSTPLHITATRHSPPNSRAAISVVYDLLIHDLDLAIRLSGSQPTAGPDPIGWVSPSTRLAEIAACSLRLEDGGIAALSASRAAQRKIREITVTTPVEQIELDLMRRTMTVYRHVHHEQSPIDGGYRADTVIDIPFVRQEGEPLAMQLKHFVGLIKGDLDHEAERLSIVPSHLLAFGIENSISP